MLLDFLSESPDHFYKPVVMILRVYAIWNRSKMILYILLCLYVPHVIVSFTLTGIYDNPYTYFSGVL